MSNENNKNVVILYLSAVAAMFHLYTAGFTLLPAMLQRPIHWLFMSILIFLIFPFTNKSNQKLVSKILNLVFVVLTICACLYIIYIYPSIIYRIGLMEFWDYIFGIMMIIVVLDATRRTLGWPLVIIASFFLAYAYFGEYFPGIFSTPGYSLGRIISQVYISTDGIFGLPLGVSATVIYLFCFFSSVLSKCGAGELFTNLAMKVTRNQIGGGAKLAVVSSTFFGMISGSAVANVVTTGNFTIPLMKKTGYSKKFSAAVEAAASTGGQFMPPIMGAAAFIMAELTSVSYGEIAFRAFLPALLYFFGIFFIVDLQAKKKGMGKLTIDNEELSFREILWPDGLFLLPIINLIILLVLKINISRAIFITIVFVILIAFLIKEKRRKLTNLGAILDITYMAAKNTVAVAAGCACAGIVVGIVTLTGIGLKLTNLILMVGSSNIFLALFLLMITAIILGCGLPPSAAYILLAILGAPALVKLGFPIIASHLFLYYFVTLSVITPPVCLASYAAAGLSGSKPNETGWLAMLFASSAFLVPFIFIFSPELLSYGNLLQTILIFVITAIGVYSLSIFTIGWLNKDLKYSIRVIFLTITCLIVVPLYSFKLLGVIIFIIVFLLMRIAYSKSMPVDKFKLR